MFFSLCGSIMRNFISDIQEYYEEILRDVSRSPEQVAQEAIIIAKKWERHPRHSSGEDEPHLPVSKNH